MYAYTYDFCAYVAILSNRASHRDRTLLLEQLSNALSQAAAAAAADNDIEASERRAMEQFRILQLNVASSQHKPPPPPQSNVATLVESLNLSPRYRMAPRAALTYPLPPSLMPFRTTPVYSGGSNAASRSVNYCSNMRPFATAATKRD